jgi:hypothetical protein
MRLTENPAGPCIVCGCGKGDTSAGVRRRFVDLERDVAWDEPAIICEDDCDKIGVLAGLLSREAAQEYERIINGKDREIHSLKADLDAMRRRLRQGRAAA